MISFVPLTDDDLDRIERLTEGATHGPWIVAPEHCDSEGQGIYTALDAPCCGGGHIAEVGDSYARGCNRPGENMAFIAAARTWVPLLMAEVRRLRAGGTP